MTNTKAKIKSNPFISKDTSKCYKKTDPLYIESAEKGVEFFRPHPVLENIVDIGAGTGISAEVIQRSGGKNLTLVEPSESMLSEAKSRLKDSCSYIQADVNQLHDHFMAEVDLAYALNSFHLFGDLRSALASIACALKHEGTLIFNISAPSYVFESMTDNEKIILQANYDFYRYLNEEVPLEIFANTKNMLEDVVKGKSQKGFDRKKIEDLFQSVNMHIDDSREYVISNKSVFQKGIWQMIAASACKDRNKINEIIAKVDLPEKIFIRQIFFKAVNLNHAKLDI